MNNRLREIREVAGFTRKGVQELTKDKLKITTLQAIEDGNSNPSIEMLKDIVEFYESLNIYVDLRYLFFGKGVQPFIKENINDTFIEISTSNINAIDEAEYFKKKNSDSVIVSVQKEYFAPKFSTGMLVGAIRLSKEKYHNDYIVDINNNNIYRLNSYANKILFFNSNNEVYKVEENNEKEFYIIVWTRVKNV